MRLRLRRERGRPGDTTVELQLLAGQLQSAARALRAGDVEDAAFARGWATRIRDVEVDLQRIRLEVAAAPYVGASGARFIEHNGEIYLLGAEIEEGKVHPGGNVIIHEGERYVLSLAFRDKDQIVARPITKPGASG